MRHTGRVLCLWLLFACTSLFAQQQDEIEVAIFPYLSVHQLLELYEPLRKHLETSSGKRVRLVTARDFQAFVSDVHQQSYTLVINAPHMARLAELEAGYRAMLRPEIALYPLVVVDASEDIQRLAELRDASVATPYASAIITMMAAEMMREAGLEPGTNVHFSHAGSHNNAIEQMLNESPVKAAVISSPAFGAVSARYGERVRRLLEDHTERGLPPVVYLAGPHLSDAERLRLTESLLQFANHDPVGQGMMQRARHMALRRFTDVDRNEIDRYIPATREAFAIP